MHVWGGGAGGGSGMCKVRVLVTAKWARRKSEDNCYGLRLPVPQTVPAVLTESAQRVMFVCAFVCVCARACVCMYMRLRDPSLARFLVRARTRAQALLRVLQKIRTNQN